MQSFCPFLFRGKWTSKYLTLFGLEHLKLALAALVLYDQILICTGNRQLCSDKNTRQQLNRRTLLIVPLSFGARQIQRVSITTKFKTLLFRRMEQMPVTRYLSYHKGSSTRSSVSEWHGREFFLQGGRHAHGRQRACTVSDMKSIFSHPRSFRRSLRIKNINRKARVNPSLLAEKSPPKYALKS